MEEQSSEGLPVFRYLEHLKRSAQTTLKFCSSKFQEKKRVLERSNTELQCYADVSLLVFFFTLLDKSKIKTVFERSYHHKQQCCIEEKKKMQPYNCDKNNKTELMRYTSIFLTAHSIKSHRSSSRACPSWLCWVRCRVHNVPYHRASLNRQPHSSYAFKT